MTEADLFSDDPSQEDESDLTPPIGTATLGTSDWTAETIVRQMIRGNIELTPRFQRREAWTDERKSKFIESIILGLPIPQIVLAESRNDRGQYIVIDGKQRLLALRRFSAPDDDGQFETLRLSGLRVRKDLNGKNYMDLSDDPQYAADVRAFDNQPMRTVVVRTWPDESYLYTVFLRLNTGSVPLSPQELRQALHPGPFLDFVDRFSAEDEVLQSALRIDRPDFRMRDVEILVRFFAFSEFLQQYNGNLKKFLDDTCLHLNRAWPKRERELRKLAEKCDGAIKTTEAIFGKERAFSRWNGNSYESRFNRAVFDVMAYYFKDDDIAVAAVSKSTKVRERFERLCDEDRDFTNAIQSTTKTVDATFGRLKKWGDALAAVTGVNFRRPTLVKRRIQV